MGENERPQRRSTDGWSTDEEILTMIKDTVDNGQKGLLLLLYKMQNNLTRMSESLMQNTAVTRQIAQVQKEQSERIGNHEVREEKLINRATGAGLVLSAVSLAIGGMAWFILTGYVGEIRADTIAIKELSDRVIKLETSTPISREASSRLAVIEAQLRAMEGRNGR